MQRILVGLDGSPESLAALAWAGELAQKLGSEVFAVGVYGLNPTAITQSLGAYPSDELLAAWGQDLKTDLDGAWTQKIRDSGVKVITHIEQGDPAGVLIGLSQSLPADLIVVGSHGSGLAKELLAGSVCHQLVHRATCPLVIVPHPHFDPPTEKP